MAALLQRLVRIGERCLHGLYHGGIRRRHCARSGDRNGGAVHPLEADRRPRDDVALGVECMDRKPLGQRLLMMIVSDASAARRTAGRGTDRPSQALKANRTIATFNMRIPLGNAGAASSCKRMLGVSFVRERSTARCDHPAWKAGPHHSARSLGRSPRAV